LATKHDLKDWVLNALEAFDGSGRVAQVCQYVWEHYENELRNSGKLFYTWQYDIRWQLKNSEMKVF
jgi:hypothetical protein